MLGSQFGRLEKKPSDCAAFIVPERGFIIEQEKIKKALLSAVVEIGYTPHPLVDIMENGEVFKFVFNFLNEKKCFMSCKVNMICGYGIRISDPDDIFCSL
jgi:hypothetical protein